MTENQPQNTNDDIDIIDPEAARAAIQEAIVDRLGEDWEKEWLLVHNSNFLVRLNKGDYNMDFQAGLLGEVEVVEKRANPIQLSGRLVAWAILGTSLFLAFAIASMLNII